MARKAADGLTITSVNFSVKSGVVRKWIGADPNVALVAADAPVPAAPTPDAPAPAAPVSVAPAPVAPAPPPPAVSAPPKPAAAKPQILTPIKPYKIEDTIKKAMAEMEDLEKEMQGEIDRRRGSFGTP